MTSIRKRPVGHVWTRLLAAVLLTVSIAGCAAQPPVPEDKYYRLQAVMAQAPLATPKLPGVLEIERFSADGVVAGRPIVYSEQADRNQLLAYHYHFWTQPPTIMLRDELAAYLRKANYAKSVVTPEMRINPDYVLTGRIVRLERVLGEPNETVVELEIALRHAGDGKLLFLKTYRKETRQAGRTVPDAVRAFNEALNIIYSDLLADLTSQ